MALTFVATFGLEAVEIIFSLNALGREYWIPAEELQDFNRNIVGTIEVIAEFHQDSGTEP
jgi:hypothetical protein